MVSVSSKKIFSGIVALALGMFSTDGIQAGLISNGDFSQFTSSAPGGGPTQINNTSTGGYASLKDWTVGTTLGSPNTVLNSYAFITQTTGPNAYTFYYPTLQPQAGTIGLWSNPGAAPSGQQYAVTLDGYQGAATLSQTLTGLTAGASYKVTFDWAAVQYTTKTGNYTEQFEVFFGDSSQTTRLESISSQGHSNWISESFTFTADATSDTLMFLSLGTPSGVPPVGMLSNVNVVASPVPEPSTMLMLGLGGVCIVGIRLRRQRVD
jgi:Protein of unknown function (DUF642)/PEP-CTERM motif